MRRASGGEASALLSRYEPVVGLEVHAQLMTRTKLFCGCENRFGAPPNTLVCPVCLGLPGALPVLNRHALELALRAALALGCRVNPHSSFERKNYFYPDLPKGYQISQYASPLALAGSLAIPTPGGERRVRIARLHMEEDAGKLLHEGFGWSHEKSGIDLNRAGVPLVEIVSEPELTGAEEAHAYLVALRAVLVYAAVSDGNMEQGSLRCDANVSVRAKGASALGTRTEIKNLNSFRNVARAIEHEVARQVATLESGHAVEQETLLWDAAREQTAPMRSKEDAHDYRYFPEPDLAPVTVGPAFIDELRGSLPELPAGRRARFVAEYGLPEYDAAVLTQERELADYFEAAARHGGHAKAVSNWIMTELLRKLKQDARPLARAPVGPQALAGLIGLVQSGGISGKTAKDVFERMWASGEPAAVIVEREGLLQLDDEAQLQAAVSEVVARSPQQAESYRGGKAAALGWFVGQVMRQTGGRANPQRVNALLRKALDEPGS